MSSRKEQKAEARERRLAAERERQARARRRRIFQLGAVALVAVAAIVAIVLVAGGGDDESTGDQAQSGVGDVAETRGLLEGIPQDGTSLGDPDAEVVLTDYSDLQCPFCAEFNTAVLPELIENYVRPGRVRLELRLLRFLGPDSDRGARAAYEAAQQDRMWEFVDLWYRNQGPENSGYADDEFIAEIARGAGLPEDELVDAANSMANERPLQEAEQEADIQGIDSTPSFLVGPEGGRGQRLQVNELTFEAFRAALDPMLE